MPLSPAQSATLKSDVAANTATIPAGQPWTGSFGGMPINAVPNSGDGNTAIAEWYNFAASPAFTRWRKLVPLSEISKKINGTELAGLTTGNHTRLQTVTVLINAGGGLDASLADQRRFFDDIFSGAGGTTTRANLLALWKKPSTNAEKLFATGTGSDATPATSAFGEGFLLTAADADAKLGPIALFLIQLALRKLFERILK